MVAEKWVQLFKKGTNKGNGISSHCPEIKWNEILHISNRGNKPWCWGRADTQPIELSIIFKASNN